MKYRDLRGFIAELDRCGDVNRVIEPISVELEMTALSDAVLRAAGPALLFEQPKGHHIKVLTNLFGTPRRVALGMGAQDVSELREVGSVLARLKEPEPPSGMKDAGRLLHLVKALWDMKPSLVRSAPSQEIVVDAADIDLANFRFRPAGRAMPGR